MEVNPMQILFIFNTLSIVSLGFIVRMAEPYLPIAIVNLFRHGKFAAKGKSSSLIPTVQVPKKWFKHFYEFAVPLSTYVLFIALYNYLGIGSVPKHIFQILDILLGASRKPLVSPEQTTLALVLITIQCWKRYYETHHVNIYSDSKMNLGHYVVGFLHYVGTISCIVGESHGFFGRIEATVNWNRLTYIDYSCAVIFLWASYKQFSCNIILANLRKNKKGEIITLQHKIPKGGLFDYISSPLQFTEMLMYFMLTVILRSSRTFYYISAWVLTNQIATGLFSHWWYLESFEDYPKQRKVLIPGIW